MMRTTSLFVLVALVVLGLCPLAEGSAIVGMGPGTGTSFPPDLAGTVDSFSTPSAIFDTDAPDGSGIGDPTGTISLGVTALDKFRPFSVNFSSFDTSAIDGILVRTFSFAVTVTNGIGDRSAAEPDAANGHAYDDISNLEFEIVRPAGTGHAFVSQPPLTVLYTNGFGNSVLRFGGLAGGGPAISDGGSHTYNFTIATTSSFLPWSLRITANPEPTSLMLGGLGLCLASGVGFVRRRVRTKKSDTEPNPLA